VFYLVVFSLIATFVLNRYNSRIEKGKRQLLALNLGSERDPAAEMKFAQMVPSLLNDKDLLFPQDTRKSAAYEDSIITELQDEYFGEYWNNYIVQITLCYGKKQLKIQPQNYLAGCEDYFRGLLLDFGKTTFSEYLYYLDYGSGYQNYLARVPIRYAENPADTAGWAYIEISSKLIFRDLGYPELLVDKKNNHLPDISGYSYAFYRSGKLIHRVGKYFYNMDLDHASMNHSLTAHFYEHDGMSHYCYPIDQNNVLLVSKKSDSFIDLMAPFSYLFFGFAMFSMLFILIVKMPVLFNISSLRLRDRLQISMTALLISSLLIIGFLIVYYIVRLNSSKNIDNLTDRTHSILVELQHKFSREDDLKKVNPEDLNQLLTKFSNVFFSDINLYSPEGRLIATSRPQIFEEGLVSSLMNYRTMSRFRVGHNSFITLEESIGDHSYYSSYIPFYNDDNQLLAYLNLPYFARQEDLKKEISTFLIAFINIYVLLIILGIFLALIVAGYISYPLRLLTSSIGKLALGTTSEKLTWRRNDEIGKLVNEYNRMTDELARNAELLARSERETAWREMARQVAHEIKNPLTPMMLSVQHLEKAWKEKASDWDQRLIRFTENMKEQIESLSTIATEFSDFAKMPQTRNEKLELNEVIGNVVSLYSNNIPVRISFECPERYYPVIADRKQILRVFTNLINNSVEAIGNKIAGEIKITLNVSEGKNIVKIMDNGSGMSQEQAKRIFQPNFTTKSGGTGLGLAIVKSIVLGAGGDISFETEEGKGTTFTVQFPLNMED
jgi:signal transduction histidine kinase